VAGLNGTAHGMTRVRMATRGVVWPAGTVPILTLPAGDQVTATVQ